MIRKADLLTLALSEVSFLLNENEAKKLIRKTDLLSFAMVEKVSFLFNENGAKKLVRKIDLLTFALLE